MSALKKSNLLVHVFKEAYPKFSQIFFRNNDNH